VPAIAVGALALLATACSSSSKGSSSNTTAPAGSTTATTASGGPTTGASGNTASATGITPTTIKIGYITDETGVASSTFVDGAQGALARFQAENAAGGVEGRQIQMITVDGMSTPAGNLAAAEKLVSDGVYAVIDYSSFTFGGYKVFQQAGIPVTGYAFDGPEWGQEPNSNMFSFLPPVSTSWGGYYYYPNWAGNFFKSVGADKPAGFAYGISPSSQASIKVIYEGASQSGVSNCYANYSVPFGGVDFTADVLSVKSAGCNGVAGSFVDASDQAMATSLTQAGLTNVKKLWYTGYDSNTLATSAAKAAFEGSYFATAEIWYPSSPPIATMLSNLAKYDSGFKQGDIPDFGLQGSYIAADLMIFGLQHAGQNPTRPSFINNLRQVSSYNAGGILPGNTSFTDFGTPAMNGTQGCEQFVQLVNGAFVSANPGGKPVCAPNIKFAAS
jgi:branched-chain amino acid transport system substrate-binding protein